MLSKSKVSSTQKVRKNCKSVPARTERTCPTQITFVQKNEWCGGSDDVKENAGEQSEDGLFSKSSPSSDRTRFM